MKAELTVLREQQPGVVSRLIAVAIVTCKIINILYLFG